jgi:hypothetical protein
MAWNDSPPTKQELSWMDSPPTNEELGIVSQPEEKPSLWQQIKQGVGLGARNALKMTLPFRAKAASEDIKRIVQNPKQAALDVLEAAPAVGTVAFPVIGAASTGGIGLAGAGGLAGLGAAAGESARQIGRHYLGAEVAPKVPVPIPFVNKELPRIPIPGLDKKMGDQVSNLIQQAALGTLSGMIPLGGKKVDLAGENLAMRHAGFNKSTMHKLGNTAETERLVRRAQESSRFLRDEGLISKTGSIQSTKNAVDDILNAEWSKMEDVISQADALGAQMEGKKLDHALASEIKPVFAEEEAAMKSITDDINRLTKDGTRPLSIAQAQQLQKRWGNTGFRGDSKDPATKVYRKAYDRMDVIVSGEVERNASRFGPEGEEMASRYLQAKKNYGLARHAKTGIMQKLTGEKGNNMFSLPSIIIGSAQLASGNVGRALTTLGILQGLRNRGAGIGANLTKLAWPVASLPPAMTAGGTMGYQYYLNKKRQRQ